DRLLDEHGQPYPHRACVDSAPLNERTLARLAGLGWIGRNALLLHPRRGSWHLLGCLLTAAPLRPRPDTPMPDHCGRCTRCETACPTGALQERRCLSTRCISYLTIEHHGVIPRTLAARFQGWWFGCDICQEVCPWNRFAGSVPVAAKLRGRDDTRSLLAVTATDFDRAFAGRAVRRIGYERFRRNLLVAAWSLGLEDIGHACRSEPLPLIQAQARELGLPTDDS
ncbi:MAG: epoxyqueuosine reductase, partial [Planctomycetota bacterium]